MWSTGGAAECAGGAGTARPTLHADRQPLVKLVAGGAAALVAADGVGTAGAAAGIRLHAAFVLQARPGETSY